MIYHAASVVRASQESVGGGRSSFWHIPGEFQGSTCFIHKDNERDRRSCSKTEGGRQIVESVERILSAEYQ